MYSSVVFSFSFLFFKNINLFILCKLNAKYGLRKTLLMIRYSLYNICVQHILIPSMVLMHICIGE